MRARADAEKIPEFVELLRNHAPTASDALIEALGGFGGFNGFGLAETEVRDRLTPAFQRGVRAAIDATARLQGLFESTEEALRETLSMLFENMDDMRAAEEEEEDEEDGGGEERENGTDAAAGPAKERSPVRALLEARRVGLAPLSNANRRDASNPPDHQPEGAGAKLPAPLARHGTMRLRAVHRDARSGDAATSAWLLDWEDVMREEKTTCARRCREWAKRQRQRRGAKGNNLKGPPTTTPTLSMRTGFLDVATGRDVVDCYELWVRLSHLAHRGSRIARAAATAAPSSVHPRIYLGGALAANSEHTLRALGVRSVLNCTDDLADALIDAVPPFNFGRVPVEDTPETDIAATFEAASAFIADAIEGECEGEGGGKGGVLVHCFEGKSRSATIVAQHLVRATRRPLREVLERAREAHPGVRPNAGFLTQLSAFERRALGSASDLGPFEAEAGARAKPKARRCPACGAECGVSLAAVAAHARRAHGAGVEVGRRRTS